MNNFNFNITKDGYEFYLDNKPIRIINYTVAFQTVMSFFDEIDGKCNVLYLTGFVENGDNADVVNIKYDFDREETYIQYLGKIRIKEKQNEI